MAKAREFDRNMKKLAGFVLANSSLALKRAALAIDAQVVVATPVDTGRARANWLVGIDAPVTTETANFSKGKGKSTERAVTQRSINQAKIRILQHVPGQSIYISNNVNYIRALNRGTSRQAPPMFVESAIVAGIAAVKGVRLLRNNGITFS